MKAIFLTFSTTIAAVAVASTIFLNTILGVFGLAATSAETLQNLQASHKIVERMKKRHKQKRLKATNRFAKRSVKRVASTALAAATIGTVAVAVTLTTFEIVDYCEEKQELQEDNNILFGVQAEFDYAQCIKEGKEDSKVILSQLKNSSVETVSSAFDNTVHYGTEKWEAVKEASLHGLKSAGEATSSLWSSVELWVVVR